MVSSLLDRPVSDKLIAIGEVGLGGEVRSVPNLEQRLHEAERIGFERAVIPKHSLNHLSPADYPGMQLIGAAYITDAINALKSDRLLRGKTMSIYLDEKNPGKHKPFDDAAPDIVEYVRYLEVIAGKSANTAFSYYCDLRGFSRFMKRRRGLVPEDSEMKDIDPKGLDTAFWASVTKEDIYEYLYFLNRECGNKKSSTARRLASLHGFYDYLVNQVNRLDADPTAAIHPPKQDKVLPKYLTAEQSMELLESTQTQSDFPERDYCMVTLFLNCGMRLAELVGMNLDDIDLENRQIRLFGKGHKERMVYLNDACMEALRLYLGKRNTMEGLLPQEKAVFITRRRKERISNRRVEQLVTGAMKAAGLKGFSTHKLRHTAATLMYQTGNVDILL